MKTINYLYVVAFTLLTATTTGQSPYSPPDLFGETAKGNYNFYQNKGQILHTDGTPARDLYYYTNSSNPNIYVGDRRASFVMVKHDTIHPDSIARVDLTLPCTVPSEHDVTRNEDPCSNIPIPVKQVPGHLNYYLGHVPTGVGKVYGYERLVFEDIYPGIDWHLYSNEMYAKMYFVVHPGADPSDIVLKFEGQDSLKLDTISGLKAYVRDDFVYVPQALAYQVDGSNNIIPLNWQPAFNYPVNGETGFVSGSYDPGKKLVFQIGIPPYTTAARGEPGDWSTEYGSWLKEESRDVETDGAGSVYIIGNTNSTGFPTTAGAFQDTANWQQDGFIGKWDNQSIQQWTTYLGGDDLEELYGSTLDNGDNIYVVGRFQYPGNGLPFPTMNPGGGAYFDNVYSSGDAVVTKFRASDGAYVWGTYFGGSGDKDRAHDVTYKDDGHIYVVGMTNSPTPSLTCSVPASNNNFPICNTSNYSEQTYGGNTDGFIAKFDTSGVMNWSTYVGGYEWDELNSADIDPSNRLVVLGESRGQGMYLENLSGAYHDTYNGGGIDFSDLYIARFTSADQINWSTYFGSNGHEFGESVTTDQSGSIFITGTTHADVAGPSTGCNTPPSNTGFPLCNASGAYFSNSIDQVLLGEVFISKFNASCKLVWSTFYGGKDRDYGYDIHATQGGNLYVVGLTGSTDFHTVDNGNFYYQDTLGGEVPNDPDPAEDSFVLNFSTNGALKHATYYGGKGQENSSTQYGNDVAYGVADFFEHTLYFAGLSRSIDFPYECPATTTFCYPDPNHNEEAFIVKWATGYVGIDETKGAEHMGLEIYPNPAESGVTIGWTNASSDPSELHIYDMLGKQVLRRQVSSCSTKCQVNISLDLEPGVYTVQIIAGSKRLSQKLVIQ